MKPYSPITHILAAIGSSLLAISYSHGQTTLANDYLTSLSVGSPTTLYSSLNFPSYLDGPLTGSSTLTTTGNFGSLLYFINNGAGNTFNGNIIVDSGTLRVGTNPFLTTTGGFTAPSMTSSNTITINRAGTLFIDDNSTTGYTANRFGSGGSYPDINLAGGRLDLNGLNNASSSVQTFGALTASSGQATITVTRNSTGNPTLAFDSLTIDKGAVVNFYSATLGTGTNDARITFDTAPTLINGILAGAKVWSPGAAGQGTFATYGANGVAAFTAFDVYALMDINAATSTQNVQMTGAFAPVALSGDVTVNSLNYNGNGGTWSLGGNKLTLTSGMFLRNGTNQALIIDNGTLTAGNGTDDIDLHFFTAQNSVTVNAVISDNASSAVTVVKSHGNNLALSGGADNTYTGGTYVVDGSISTGNVANRTYLGTGQVTVDNALLSLGNIGATSNATGDDYTAINSAQINIASGANGAYTASDTFNIAAGSIISSNGSAAGQGLASLTRDTNITLAENAVIGHGQQTATLNLSTGTIQNLGTSSEFFYGLANTNQNNAGGSIEIGNGTAFKGISTDRSARAWQQGTINITSGTTSVDFQGFQTASAAPAILTLGNGGTAGAPVINFAGTGTVDIRALGSLTLNDSTATYGDTSASQNVRFVSTAGSTLTVTPADGLGSGTGIASALVQEGGLLAIGNAAALNGGVTVDGGGQFNANQAGGLTGSGALTFNEGAIINITNALGFSGTQASDSSLAAGTIVRLGVNNYGAAGTTLDSIVGGSSPIYQLTGNNAAANPTSPGTTVMTLNKNGSGVGGILTNDLSSRTLNNTTNGVLTLGANGGTIAATTGTILTVAEDVTGAGSLTIGSTSAITGAPKAGQVTLSNASNNYTGGTIINSGLLLITSDAHLGDAAGSVTLNGGGLAIGSSLASNRELILNNAAGNLIRLQGNVTWTHTGNITGDGGVTFRQNPNGGVTADLQGTANTFKGPLGIEFNNGGTTVKIRSLEDNATANGNIVFGTNTGFAGNNLAFQWDSAAAGGLTLDNRAVEFAQNGDSYSVIRNSHATEAITINTNLVVSGTGTKNLALDAIAAGPGNLFAGDIGDGNGTVALYKTGSGSWTLSGNNTYSGDTNVTGGNLILDDNGSLQFTIGANGVNNSVTGNSTITLNGDFVFDLTSADNTVGNSWTIVNVGTLNETFGGTFQVASTLGSFTGDSGIWSKVENGVIFEFTQNTGLLTILAAVPEPSTAALLSVFAALLMLRRRRNG